MSNGDKFATVMSLKVTNLTKIFDSNAAVNGISFEVTEPSVVGFLGPNGAGKTTTMRIVTGFLKATSGTVTIDGETMSPDSFKLRSQIGYLPESNPLYPELEVREFLQFAAELAGMSPATESERMDFVIERCSLKEVLFEPISHLSKGYKQRVGLAQAIVHDPKILILDEPTSGLDPNQVIEIRKLISELAREKFVILSTHILSEVQALCDRVLIISEGKLVLDSSTSDLQHRGTGNISITLKTSSSLETVRSKIGESIRPVSMECDRKDETVTVLLNTDDSDALREKIFDTCVSNGFKIIALTGGGSDLEALFRKLTVGADET